MSSIERGAQLHFSGYSDKCVVLCKQLILSDLLGLLYCYHSMLIILELATLSTNVAKQLRYEVEKDGRREMKTMVNRTRRIRNKGGTHISRSQSCFRGCDFLDL